MRMSRYIDADELIEDVRRKRGLHEIIKGVIYSFLHDAPTADVVESKRGEWIKLPSNGIGNTAECSVCHDSVYGYESCDFCPNCGADMRGDE